MTKYLKIILVFISFTHLSFAQNNSSVSYDGKKLIGKKWYLSETVNGVRVDRTMIFDKDSVKEVIVQGNKTIIRHDAYYLDNEQSIVFYPEKIGQKTQGKFLYHCDGDCSFGVFIHKLTDDEFIYSFYKNSPLKKFTAIKDK